jgi:hypothetical protein
MDDIELIPVLDDLAQVLEYTTEDRFQRLQLFVPQ